jgi:hypothetical protein
MARRLHLLFLILICFSVGAEVLLATPGLPSMQADQVHNCGFEEAKLPGEIEAGETDPVDPPAHDDQLHSVVRLTTTAAEETGGKCREGMRWHRWCGVDLN